MKKTWHYYLLHSRIARLFRLGVLTSIVLTILNTTITLPASFFISNAMAQGDVVTLKSQPISWLDIVVTPAVAKTPELASALVPLLCAMLGVLAARIRSWFVISAE